MQSAQISKFRPLLAIATVLLLFACGGGGGGSSTGAPPPAPETSVPPEPVPEPIDLTDNEAARFLSQATFGPDREGIDELVSIGAEDWLLTEFDKPASLHLDAVLSGLPPDGQFFDDMGNTLPEVYFLAADSFWQTAIKGDDQLRQRMAYALSQILVISAEGNLGRTPHTVAHYMDVLTTGAFGNYRDLLDNVTYSPAISIYLTYMRNEKADPATGRVPDENYARELLQLFTLGLVALNPDGTPVKNPDGSQVELFDNSDITEVAKVFTGLSFDGPAFNTVVRFLPQDAFYKPLVIFDEFHSNEAKSFLGANIPAGTSGEQTIDMALDIIFEHPNLGPFVCRQLIQRFVTSAPSPDYVGRVAAAFESGSYSLPSGTSVGTGERGDLQAVIAAVLFDTDARNASSSENAEFGKLREPVLRFTHWARAFEINSADASNEPVLHRANRPDLLGQHAYRSPSVFNFYRPGYIAAGTATGDAGLTAPELQITNASSIVGYPNFMTLYALDLAPRGRNSAPRAFVSDYSPQTALAADADALLDNLDQLLTHGTLQAETRARITEILDGIGAESDDELLIRAQIASVLVMTSPEYIVLR